MTLYTDKDNSWREYANPLRGITLESVVAKIETGERGAFADLQWFYQAMEKSDAMIVTVVQRRRAALLSCSWDVREEALPTDAGLAREQAAYLRDCYDAVENLKEAVAFLSTAIFRGYSHVEKHFGKGGGVVRFEPVEQWFWCREGMFGEWTYNRGARSGVDRGEKIKPGNFVVVEAPVALDRILSVLYFRRNVGMRDWSSFLDVYGIPSVFIKGPPNATPEKELEYYEVAKSIMRDGRGYLPNGSEITYADGGGKGKPPFRDHLDYTDRQIVLVGTGGLLTMLTESGSGTLAGSAHQQAFDQLAKGDAVLISEALQRDFDKPLLDAAFPGWPVEAGFQLLTPGEIEPPWMTFMKQQQAQGGSVAPAAANGGAVIPAGREGFSGAHEVP